MEFLIKIWSQVRLKSGGPEMTASSLTQKADGTQYATCKWEDDEKKLHMTDFPVEALETIQ